MFKRIFIAIFCIVALAITPSVNADEELDAKFAAATEAVRALPEEPPRPAQERLEFYGLYKVGSVGPCPANQLPGATPEGLMKLMAWRAKSNMSMDEAKQAYISKLTALKPDW